LRIFFLERSVFCRKFTAESGKTERKMYGPELVFEIFNFGWKHVFTFFSENMAKMQLHRKIHYSKANKAVDVVFAENVD